MNRELEVYVQMLTSVKEYHDMGTNDFLIGVMEKHEKMAWMLRAHIDKP